MPLTQTIYKTEDYDQFSYFDGNRDLVPANVKGLIQSIGEENRLEDRPIDVNGEKRVIDGQHRLEAARKLGIPIYYKVMKNADINTARRLNAHARNWNLATFLESYVKEGVEEYVYLNNFMKKYDLPLMLSVRLLKKKGEGRHGKSQFEFKSGKLSLSAIDNALKVVNYLMNFRGIVDNHIVRSREFVYAIEKIVDNDLIDKDRLVEKVIKFHNRGEKITRTRNITETLVQLENVYNRGRGEKSRVRFY